MALTWRPMAVGKGSPKRGLTYMRSARDVSAIALRVAFRPMVRPNRVNAMTTDSKVRIARAGLRMMAAQTSGKYFIGPLLPGYRLAAWPYQRVRRQWSICQRLGNFPVQSAGANVRFAPIAVIHSCLGPCRQFQPTLRISSHGRRS